MKKILYTALLATGVLVMTSCDPDLFRTAPTDSVSESTIFSTPEAAQVAMNGIYRSLYSNVWGTAWQSEHPGLAGFTLAQCLNAEDNVQFASGNGWFWYDYNINIDSDYTGTAGRQFSNWEMFYTSIAQTNYVIAYEEQLSTTAEGKDVVAQAYAMRGFAYLCLTENFCQGNYPAAKSGPGVPVYTEPTTAKTVGQPRGTLEQTFTQITEDLDYAIGLFESAETEQTHPSHIDLYTACGFRARAALVMQDWDAVYTNATKALTKPGLARVATMKELGGFSDRKAPDVLWAFEINAEAAAPFGGFFSFMDAANGNYGDDAQQLIDKGLYNTIPDSDYRKSAWWNGDLPIVDEDPDGLGVNVDYCNKKFVMTDAATAVADIINMRAEEMILMAAEAAVSRSNPDYNAARALLLELGEQRDPDYATRLASRSDAATYSPNTRQIPATLKEEILWQRRIELWTEGMGRLFDLRRLNLGFNRAGSNHTARANVTYVPGDVRLVYLIPQKEFDSNPAMSAATDQNPR